MIPTINIAGAEAQSPDVAQIPLTGLYHSIAAILEAGNEQIAQIGAAALRRHAPAAMPGVAAAVGLSSVFLPGLLRPDAHAVGPHLHDLFSKLNWRHSGSENGKIRNDLSAQMLTCELVGPTGIVFDPDCRVGLFAQNANLDYPERSHPAEELFVMLSGSAFWRRSGMDETVRMAGGRIHHFSGERHASRTAAEPFVAVWVWTGDIDFDKYELHG